MYCNHCGKKIVVGVNYCGYCGEKQSSPNVNNLQIDHYSLSKYIRLGVSIMLLLALASLPYGYYILLRWVVSVTSVYIAYLAYKEKKQWWITLFLFITVLFNPVVPIYLNREMWAIIDIIVALLFIISIFQVPKKQ